MAQITLVGRVTADLEVKESGKKEPYVRFCVSETVGTYKNMRTQIFQVCAFGDMATELAYAGVHRDTFIWISGNFELEDYSSLSLRAAEKRMRIYLRDWRFAATEPPKISEKTVVETIDGDRDPLP